MLQINKWAEKGDLKLIIKKAIEEDVSFPEKKIWEYIHQIAGALGHMHEKRIMHRDLKPANIFIDQQGNLKVGDLGLSRQLGSQTFEAFSRVGTPLYMSPEVLQGKGYDWKSDVWSLGCIAYEICMLRSPFRQDDKENLSLYDLFQRITKGQFPPISEKYSPELRQVVMAMLKQDPDQRFDIAQVCELCETYKKMIASKPQIDTYLIMDDIIEKLSLLDYENSFCKGWKQKRVSRIYFAHPSTGEDPTQRANYVYDMTFWLMSLNKEKSKKLGPFVPFKDFKGNLNDAMAKLITDLKKFGYSGGKTLRQEQIKPGYGNEVCHIIDELLNLELYRREFQFNQPIIPPDDEEPQEDDEQDNDQNDSVIMINGGQIEAREIRDSSEPYNIGSSSNQKQRNKQQFLNGEETKINFYDPQAYLRNGDKYYQIEKEEDEQILEGKIDPQEWRREMDRVYGDLDAIEKDIELSKQRGQFAGGNYDDDVEECRRHIELIIDLCRDIKDTCHQDVRNVFARSAEKLEEDLSYIRKNEIRINQNNAAQITKLNSITQTKKNLAQELRQLIDIVKKLDFENKDLQNKINSLNHQYDELVADIGGQRQIKKLKSTIVELKKQIKEVSLNEGIIQNTLFHCDHMHKGKHHLFDELDKGGILEDSHNLDDEFYKSLKLQQSSKKLKIDIKA